VAILTVSRETWPAMGTTATIELSGDRSHLAAARQRLEELEQRWSRFLPASDISRCNNTRGIPVDVHADTRLLVRQAIHASALTEGRYDPTVHDALVAAGYDRSFEQLSSTPGLPTVTPARKAAPGVGGIRIDDAMGTVTLPIGVGFDPGGIGKGLAADLVAEELLAKGARGIFISIGGDIRVAGEQPDGAPWLVEIIEPSVSRSRIAKIAITDGAVATSTDQKRIWRRHEATAHHIIDPSTGSPAGTHCALVTTVTADAWWAEALATRIMLTPPTEWCEAVGRDAALVVDHSGRHHKLGRIEEFLR
jgi:thiamine biosynthesis lipoprotein